jgi:hypothetical protein
MQLFGILIVAPVVMHQCGLRMPSTLLSSLLFLGLGHSNLVHYGSSHRKELGSQGGGLKRIKVWVDMY